MAERIKLPKQWRNWCADQRLGQHGHGRSQHGWFYLKGRGHHWRVNCYGQFQCGDNYADFDRWALCDIVQTSIPTTREEFRAFVRAALAAKIKSSC